MESDKKWFMLATGAATLGLCTFLRHRACNNSEPKSLIRTKSERKSYTGGGTRQYSLPAKGCTDIATSYNEVMVIGHRGACGRFPEHSQKGYHEVPYSLPVRHHCLSPITSHHFYIDQSHSLPTDPLAVSGGAGWG